MHVTKNPFPGLSHDELGVNDEQFSHKSELHGQGHVNRVIWWALQLCKAYGNNELLPACWAAAYIHDLSRRHDGVCREHGKWAIDEQWEKYLPLFRRAGLKEEHDERVINAVIAHCTDIESEDFVMTCLKDADAIDRVRLGDLNYSMLRLRERSVPYARQFATDLMLQTRDDSTWENVWSTAVKICTRGTAGCAETITDIWVDNESRIVRMQRRLKQSEFDSSLPLDEDFDKMNDLCPLRLARCRPYTYMPADAYEKFRATKKWFGFWELRDLHGDDPEKMWHYRFSDMPHDVRAYCDRRLWGEKGRHIVHGVLLSPDYRGRDARFREMYGPVRIDWKEWVLSHSTCCIGDSQNNAVCHEYSHEAYEFLVKRYLISSCGEALRAVQKNKISAQLIRQFFKNMQLRGQLDRILPNFVEIQIHGPVTWDDVENVSKG